jgi:hypothetical protein
MPIEHPFPGMPQTVTPTVTKPTTSTPSKPLARTAIVQGSPSLPTHPPSSDSCTALVQSTYSDSPRKWIVVDHDGSETWFSGHDGAWGWFMASPFAVRLYLLTGGVRTLIGGLPYSPKPWHSNSIPYPLIPKIKHTQILVWDVKGTWLGSCHWEGDGWRFLPVILHRKPGLVLRDSWQECIPAWATPLITKWVLVE